MIYNRNAGMKVKIKNQIKALGDLWGFKAGRGNLFVERCEFIFKQTQPEIALDTNLFGLGKVPG